jgi:hypothetical protein
MSKTSFSCTKLAAMLAAAALSACGGGDGTIYASPDTSGDAAAAAPAATAASTAATTTTTTAAAATVTGCTGKVAAFFALSKGSYSAPAVTFDNVDFATTPASVAGFANGGTQSVTIAEDCTITVGSIKLSYKDGSYAEFPGTGADAGKTQYDVDMTGAGVAESHFERFTSGKRGVAVFDPVKTSQGARFDE